MRKFLSFLAKDGKVYTSQEKIQFVAYSILIICLTLVAWLITPLVAYLGLFWGALLAVSVMVAYTYLLVVFIATCFIKPVLRHLEISKQHKLNLLEEESDNEH